LISVGRIQSYLGVTGDSTYLQQVEKASVADVEHLTGRYLGTAKTVSDVLDVPPLPYGLTSAETGLERIQSVRLSQPAASLAALTIYERMAPGYAWSAALAKQVNSVDAFELVGRRLYRVIGTWPVGVRTVRVDYTFGASDDNHPVDFDAVVLDLIAARYRSPQLRSFGSEVQSIAIRGASASFHAGRSGWGIPDDLYKRIIALRDAGSF